MDRDPIIPSLLDADTYKFKMGNFILLAGLAGVRVRFTFINRTKEARLADTIPVEAVHAEFAHVRSLRVTEAEIAHLRDSRQWPKGLLSERYLAHLRGHALPEIDVRVCDGQFVIEVEGPWLEVIHWETIVLSIMNELYYRHLMASRGAGSCGMAAIVAEGRRRLAEKTARIAARPTVRFAHFGTRRRFARAWEEQVLEYHLDRLPSGQVLGASNVRQAMRFDVMPAGTIGHEVPMVYAAVADAAGGSLRGAQMAMVRDWFDLYGPAQSCPPTDTFGSAAFFADLPDDLAHDLASIKHDSGDPLWYMREHVFPFYAARGIDPVSKKVVFSDGHTVDSMLRVDDALAGAVGYSFGWGTNLTNDLGFRPLSLVMKVTRAAGVPTVKLSDNPAKFTGDPVAIERYRTVFDYAGDEREECVY